MTVHVLARAGADERPLAAFIDATQLAVHEVLDAVEPELAFKGIARLSGHLAAMRRAVYPNTVGSVGGGEELRAACLGRSREVERALRLLERHLSGDVGAVGLPAAALPKLVTQRLGAYWQAERALVTGIEEHLAAERRVWLAGQYRRALLRAPTRPHPRSPRSGPLCRLAFWAHGRWDRVLDTLDSRAGVGRDFLTR